MEPTAHWWRVPRAFAALVLNLVGALVAAVAGAVATLRRAGR
jgi:hypothetical protein